jgi:hypothetical protein
MSTEAENTKITELTQAALDYLDRGKLAEASRSVKEASSINADHPQVRAAFEAIEQDQAGTRLPQLCQKFLVSNKDLDIEYALDYFHKHPHTSPQVLKDAMFTLMDYTGDSDTADELTGDLLKLDPPKRILISKLKIAPTVTFNHIFDRGDDSMDGQTDLLLNPKPWDNEGDRIAAERDVFQLCLAALMKAGQDFPERAMKCIARLLGAEAKNLNGLIDADGFDVILSGLDIRLPSTLKSQASLACVRLLQLSPENAKLLISQYIVHRIIKPSGERLIQSFSAAAAVFPMEPKAASETFLDAGFLPNFANLIRQWRSVRLEQAALELLNVACMDPNCRDAIRKYCPEWLQEVTTAAGTDQRRMSQTTMANLVLEKIANTQPKGEEASYPIDDRNAQEKRLYRFQAVMIDPKSTKDTKTSAIEGRAFASIQPWAKDHISQDKDTLKSLIALYGEDELPTAARFGILSILANITTYRPVISDEQKKLAELKAYAASTKLPPPDPLDDDGRVTIRCKKLLDIGIVPLLKKHKQTTPTSQFQTLTILNSLSRETPHRSILARQGTIRYLITTYDNLTLPEGQLVAAHALARILISVNPAHAFTPPTSPSSAIRPLVSLLAPDPAAEGPRNLLPTFEALLALTNLASLDEDTADAIVRRAWQPVEDDLILNANTRIQRAATELICNLSTCPAGAAQFTAGARANTRLRTLIALADAEDVETRRAAAGGLAILSEWDEVATGLLQMDGAVEKIMAIADDENAEVVIRGLSALRNCVLAAKGSDKVKVKSVIASQDGIKVLEKAVKGGDAGVGEVVAEVVRALG